MMSIRFTRGRRCNLIPGRHRLAPRTVLVVIMIVAAAARGLAAWSSSVMHITHSPDTGLYIELATSLVDSGEFSAAGQPNVRRTPGYPALLALGILGGGIPAMLAIQVLLSCASVLLVFALVRNLCTVPQVALIAAAVYAIEPLSVVFAGRLMSETAFTTAFLALLLSLIQLVKTGSYRYALLSG